MNETVGPKVTPVPNFGYPNSHLQVYLRAYCDKHYRDKFLFDNYSSCILPNYLSRGYSLLCCEEVSVKLFCGKQKRSRPGGFRFPPKVILRFTPKCITFYEHVVYRSVISACIRRGFNQPKMEFCKIETVSFPTIFYFDCELLFIKRIGTRQKTRPVFLNLF